MTDPPEHSEPFCKYLKYSNTLQRNCAPISRICSQTFLAHLPLISQARHCTWSHVRFDTQYMLNTPATALPTRCEICRHSVYNPMLRQCISSSADRTQLLLDGLSNATSTIAFRRLLRVVSSPRTQVTHWSATCQSKYKTSGAHFHLMSSSRHTHLLHIKYPFMYESHCTDRYPLYIMRQRLQSRTVPRMHSGSM